MGEESRISKITEGSADASKIKNYKDSLQIQRTSNVYVVRFSEEEGKKEEHKKAIKIF